MVARRLACVCCENMDSSEARPAVGRWEDGVGKMAELLLFIISGHILLIIAGARRLTGDQIHNSSQTEVLLT